MPTLDATVGGPDANSYATIAEGDTYFGERVQAPNWTGESSVDVKAQALIMATRRIDHLSFRGVKTTDVQALKWPRIGAFDESGYEYDPAAIPALVKQATFEWALHILNGNAGGTDPFADGGLEQFDRAKVGPLEVEIRKAHKATKTPDIVMRILRPLLRGSGLMAMLERS
jgi:hypothetical protein